MAKFFEIAMYIVLPMAWGLGVAFVFSRFHRGRRSGSESGGGAEE